MPLLAEQLVDEWLNREGYFTIRGIKDGVNEMDLLAIKPAGSEIEARHVEVQISFRPVSYISRLSSEYQQLTNTKSANSAKKRERDVLQAGIKDWVEKKFFSPTKVRMRQSVFPKAKWKYEFVHGQVKDRTELELIESHGIKVISFKQVLSDLCTKKGWTGGAGTDIAEMIAFYADT